MGANTSTEKVPTSSSARPAAPSFGARAPSPAANHANASQRGHASEPPGEDGPGSLLFVVFLGFLLDFLVLVVVLFFFVLVLVVVLFFLALGLGVGLDVDPDLAELRLEQLEQLVHVVPAPFVEHVGQKPEEIA